MKAEKYRSVLKQHPYLERFLWLDPEQQVKPRDVHYIAVRPLHSLQNRAFSQVKWRDHGMLDNYAGMSVDVEEWTVILRTPERGRMRYLWCRLPFTEKKNEKRVFYDPKKRDSYGIKELGARSEMDVWAFMRHQLKIHPERYRTYVELEAVVCVKRFISLQYLGHQPLQITVYRES